MNFDDIKGKTLAAVELNAARDKLTLRLADGTLRTYRVEGDCCSRSWIEHLETPGDIVGAVLLDVVDSGGITVPSGDYECLRVYNTTFRTNRGDVVLEYRNSSNGYYGGYLVEATP